MHLACSYAFLSTRTTEDFRSARCIWACSPLRVLCSQRFASLPSLRCSGAGPSSAATAPRWTSSQTTRGSTSRPSTASAAPRCSGRRRRATSRAASGCRRVRGGGGAASATPTRASMHLTHFQHIFPTSCAYLCMNASDPSTPTRYSHPPPPPPFFFLLSPASSVSRHHAAPRQQGATRRRPEGGVEGDYAPPRLPRTLSPPRLPASRGS